MNDNNDDHNITTTTTTTNNNNDDDDNNHNSNIVFARSIHPVSITRFPLTRFSPGSGLLRNPFFHR